MSYIFWGFLFGVLSPYMARRFAKFMPATAAYALYRLLWPVKTVSDERKRARKLGDAVADVACEELGKRGVVVSPPRAPRASRRGSASEEPSFGFSAIVKRRTPSPAIFPSSQSSTHHPTEVIPMSRPSE